jgi:hypothetical protein
VRGSILLEEGLLPAKTRISGDNTVVGNWRKLGLAMVTALMLSTENKTYRKHFWRASAFKLRT